MANMFDEIAKEHGVPVGQVSNSLGHNRGYVDLAELLPFGLLFGLAAIVGARGVWRRYPPAEDGWAPGITMALFVSVAFASTSALVGEVWNRVDRLFWHNHRLALFVAALLIFWLAAILVACRVRLAHSAGR
jgi:hypothetical protein